MSPFAAAPEGKRFCAQCGTQMDWRLGRWECSGCGYKDDPVAAKAAAELLEESERRDTERLGAKPIQRKPIYRDGKIVGYESAKEAASFTAPPPSSVHDPGYFSRTLHDPNERVSSYDDPLKLEKYLYMIISIGLPTVVYIIASIALMSMPYQSFGMGLSGGALLAGTLVGAAVAYGLLWWVFFGEQIWAKWTCLGCTGISTIVGLITVIAGSNAGPYAELDSLGFGWIQTAAVFFNLCFTAWFASIVYRDIQNRQY